jgi:hypothetical protein
MTAPTKISVTWREDGTATVLGRLVSRSGSGSATGVAGEGNFVQQADLSSITCAVFDLSGGTPDTSIATPTITVSTDVLDTVVTTTVIWTADGTGSAAVTGYNFLVDLAASNFPKGGHVYSVEFTITATGGGVSKAVYEGPARAVRGS